LNLLAAIVYLLAARALPADEQHKPVTAKQSHALRDHRSMTTEAKLYRDGLLVVETETESTHLTRGLRGRVFLVMVNDQGEAIAITEQFGCTTRGSTTDITTPHRGKDLFKTKIPDAVAKQTASIDIYQGEEVDLDKTWNNFRVAADAVGKLVVIAIKVL
jgi:hypothetical protein